MRDGHRGEELLRSRDVIVVECWHPSVLRADNKLAVDVEDGNDQPVVAVVQSAVRFACQWSEVGDLQTSAGFDDVVVRDEAAVARPQVLDVLVAECFREGYAGQCGRHDSPSAVRDRIPVRQLGNRDGLVVLLVVRQLPFIFTV